MYAGGIPIRKHLPGLLPSIPVTLLDPSRETLDLPVARQPDTDCHALGPLAEPRVRRGGPTTVHLVPDRAAEEPLRRAARLHLRRPADQLGRHRQPDLETLSPLRRGTRGGATAELGPGDALYIPALWWHDVSLAGGFRVRLINFWWRDAEPPLLTPLNALYHAVITMRDLPPVELAAVAKHVQSLRLWRTMGIRSRICPKTHAASWASERRSWLRSEGVARRTSFALINGRSTFVRGRPKSKAMDRFPLPACTRPTPGSGLEGGEVTSARRAAAKRSPERRRLRTSSSTRRWSGSGSAIRSLAASTCWNCSPSSTRRRFAVPTAAGLCRALGLEPPASETDAAAALQRIAARLFAVLGDRGWREREGAWTSNATLHRLGWGWAPLIGARLERPERGERMLFSRLKQWDEVGERPPPRTISVDRGPSALEARRADRSHRAARGPASDG